MSVDEIRSNLDFNYSYNGEKFLKNFDETHETDLNSEFEIGADSGDEELESDDVSQVADSLVARVKYQQENYIEKVFCFQQSYVIIATLKGERLTVCQFCYTLYLYFRSENCVHKHVNTHSKRLLKTCVEDLHCHFCNRSLYLVVLPNVCVTCNNSVTDIKIDQETKVPVLPK